VRTEPQAWTMNLSTVMALNADGAPRERRPTGWISKVCAALGLTSFLLVIPANLAPALETDLVRADFRRPTDDVDLRYWLENMVVFHRFTPTEVSATTGLTPDEVADASRRLGLARKAAPSRKSSPNSVASSAWAGAAEPRPGAAATPSLPRPGCLVTLAHVQTGRFV
jgi:hypothetical protein